MKPTFGKAKGTTKKMILQIIIEESSYFIGCTFINKPAHARP